MDLVADHTLITLDPDVDTYYLHRMGLYEMAQLAEVARLAARGGRGLSERQLPPCAADRTPARPSRPVTGRGSTRSSSARRSGATTSWPRRPRCSALRPRSSRAWMRRCVRRPRRSSRPCSLPRPSSSSARRLAYSASQYTKLYNDAIDQLFKVDLAAVGELDNALALRISGLRTAPDRGAEPYRRADRVGCHRTGLLVVRSVTLPVGHSGARHAAGSRRRLHGAGTAEVGRTRSVRWRSSSTA